MRKILHLSDLHFNRVDTSIVAALVRDVRQLAPHVVAVSGDLTQRARLWQFIEARAFLDALPRPQIVVPGNHDIPFFNVAARFLNPLGGFRRSITDDLLPYYENSEVAVAGMNTSRSLTLKGGWARDADVERICRRFARAGPDVVKFIVAHHPFDDVAHVERLIACGADVFLTGHLHVSYMGGTATRYKAAGRAAIVVEAGTATSTRLRNESNAFNLLHVDRGQVSVERFEWRPQAWAFGVSETRRFARTDAGWSLVGEGTSLS